MSDITKLNHQSLLYLIADATNSVELRRDTIKLLQDRGGAR